MDDRRDLEAWADTVLDQHRTGPKGAGRPRPASDEQLAALRPGTRRMLTRDGEVPDADVVDRMLRAAERHRRASRAYAIVTIAGGILALIFLVSLLSAF